MNTHEKKIYIEGKVTGENEQQCFDKFQEVSLKVYEEGFFPLNPLLIIESIEKKNNQLFDKEDWAGYTKALVPYLVHSAGVLLLPDWENSKGAKIEKQLADDLGIPTFNSIEELTTQLL